jgi:hypothetical protein
MFTTILPLLLVAALSSPASSSPITPNTIASSHNIFLVTCTQSNGRAGRWGGSDITAAGIAFFESPISTTPSPGGRDWNNKPRPDQMALLSSPAAVWEGTQRQSTVWNNTAFKSDIDAGAQTLAKGQIAGEASLGEEHFVRFRDGVTEIEVGRDDGRDGWGERGPGDGNGNGRWGSGGGRRSPEKEKRQRWGGGRERVECRADYWCASLG